MTAAVKISSAPASTAESVQSSAGQQYGDRQSADWRQTETADIYSLYGENYHKAAPVSSDTPLDAAALMARLLTLAKQTPSRSLPHMERLEERLDRTLAQIQVLFSTEITGILQELGLDSFIVENKIILPESKLGFEFLLERAQEVLETLSPQEPDPKSVSEFEAALKKAEPDAVKKTDPSDEFQTEIATANDNLEPQIDDALTEPDLETQSRITESPVKLEELPPPPEFGGNAPDLSAEIEQAAAENTASIAALEDAKTPESYTAAFQTAPPGVKAEHQKGFADKINTLGTQEAAEYQETVEPQSVEVRADETPVKSVTEIALESITPDPLETKPSSGLPSADIAPVEEGPEFTANDDLGASVANSKTEMSEKGVAAAISELVTFHPDLNSRVGPAPKIKLTEDADPERMGEQSSSARTQVLDRRDIAARAVAEGKGPEQVRPRDLKSEAMAELTPPEFSLPQDAPLDSLDEFAAYELDAEAEAVFDQAHAAPMRDNLQEVQQKAADMARERDTQRETGIADAEAEQARLASGAEQQQSNIVHKAQEGIQESRRQTLQAQQDKVESFDKDIAEKGDAARSEIEARVETDNKTVETEYVAAESEAEKETKAAETKAEAEKEKAEKDASKQGWWDRTWDWVGKQLDKIGELIGAVFKALKEKLGKIIQVVKDKALAIIDKGAAFVKDTIEVFGEVLKAGVTLVVGTYYPELAKELNASIDRGVERVKQAVDDVATELKKKVELAAAVLTKVLNKVLDFIEGALTTLVKIASAVAKGDWSEVARLVIDPVLRMLNIKPEDFYEYMAKALQTLGVLVSDPIGFLSNLFGALVGGFERFGDAFKKHITAGILDWLTGSFGTTLVMPEKFDFFGILDIARQLAGLSIETVKTVAEREFGPTAVEMIEGAIEYATILIDEGWGAFFTKIKEDLSGLASSIMSEIAEFLTTSLIKAGVIWIASLINPVGWLVKLVTMIWDFIMWLRDNLQRLKDIITTITNGMADIIYGRLDPAEKAIESTLARLIAPTIDLITRLIGVSGVPKAVKGIITKVHKKVEKAIRKLLRKVVGKFVKKKKGKGTTAAPQANTKLMKPITVKGGGDTHTVSLEVKGGKSAKKGKKAKSAKGGLKRKAKPVINSKKMDVEDWLKSFKTNAGMRARLKDGGHRAELTDDQISEKIKLVSKDVKIALGEEEQLDNLADTVPDNQTARIQSEGNDLKKPIERILDALEIKLEPFETKFSKDIAKTRKAVATSLKGKIAKAINKSPKLSVELNQMRWSEVITYLSENPGPLTQAIASPLHAGGVLRESKSGKKTDFFNKLIAAAAKTSTTFKADELAKKDVDLMKKLLPLLTSEHQKILIKHALSSSPKSAASIIKTFTIELGKAVKALENSGQSGPDIDYKTQIKAAAFRPKGRFWRPATYTKKFIKYYPDNLKTSTGTLKRIDFFLDAKKHDDPARAQANRTYTADMVRAAAPGQHEWVLSSTVNNVVNATIKNLEANPGDALANFIRFVGFQHIVRTDTSDIVYDPDANYKGFVYDQPKMNALRESVLEESRAAIKPVEENENSLQPGQTVDQSTLDKAEKALAAIHKKYSGDKFETYQAHAGGVNVYQLKKDKGANLFRPKTIPSQSLSKVWHDKLAIMNKEIIGDGSGGAAIIDKLGSGILKYFQETNIDKSDAKRLKDIPVHSFGRRGKMPEFGIKSIDESRREKRESRNPLQGDILDSEVFLKEAFSRYKFAYEDLAEDIKLFKEHADKVPTI